MTAASADLDYLATLRILYVEDEPTTRAQTARLLGWRVGELVVASDGIEGLERFREREPDLVVTDVLMPRMDGLSMAQEIRKAAPDLPIVVTTAFDQTSYLLKAIETGVDHYAVKPIDPDHLVGLLLKCARRLRIERRAALLEREAQSLRQQEALGILAQGLAHDFNNLAQAILGWVGVARLHVEPGSKVAEALDHAESSHQQANSLSERLMLLGEAGEFLESRGPVHGLLQDEVARALAGASVEVRFESEDADTELRFNALHLGQVFGHLARNAREAMADGGLLRVCSSLQTLTPENPMALTEGRYLHIAFVDQGPGIQPELLPRIFDPYFTTKRAFNQKGLGLGLALCQAIVRHHHGAISVESLPGRGSTFHLHLPQAE